MSDHQSSHSLDGYEEQHSSHGQGSSEGHYSSHESSDHHHSHSHSHSHEEHHHSHQEYHHDSEEHHHSHGHHKKKKGIRPIQIIGVAAALVVLVALLVVVNIWDDQNSQVDVSELQTETEEEETGAAVYYNGAWYTLRDDLEVFLLMGLDKYEEYTSTDTGYRNSQQADLLVLLVFDETNEEFCAIHLNRDTMTDITELDIFGEAYGTFTAQLALAHTYGDGGEESCENTVIAVSNLMYGMEIDHYISMTMDGVAILNDLVGGVTVTVLDDFSDVDETLVEGETVTLSGDQALTYVRARMNVGDSTNLSRMERQRQYMEAFLEQMQAAMAEDSDFTADAALEIAEYIVSDCSINELTDFADDVGTYTFTEIYSTEGEAIVGDEYMEYYIDEASLQELVIEIFYEQVVEETETETETETG